MKTLFKILNGTLASAFPTQRSRRRCPHPCSSGFTLIEILASIALLAMLGAIFASLLGSASRMYSRGKVGAEVNGEAMAILETMARDIKSAVVRSDLIPLGGSGSEQALKFCSKISGGHASNASPPLAGPSAMRELSLVSYQVSSTDAALQRVNLPVLWNDAANAGLVPLGDLTADPYEALNQISAGDERIQNILEGVLGFSWVLIQRSGAVADRLPPNWRDDPPVAFRISIAVADQRAVMILESTGRVQELTQLFAQTPSTPEVSALARWNLSLEGLDSFPADVVSGIHFFERVVPLPETL